VRRDYDAARGLTQASERGLNLTSAGVWLR
jgi:hypothetical protein